MMNWNFNLSYTRACAEIGDCSCHQTFTLHFSFSECILDRHPNGSEAVCNVTWCCFHWRTREPVWHPFLRPPPEIDSERSNTNLGLYHAVNCLFCDCDRHSPGFSLPYYSHDHFIISLSLLPNRVEFPEFWHLVKTFQWILAHPNRWCERNTGEENVDPCQILMYCR